MIFSLISLIYFKNSIKDDEYKFNVCCESSFIDEFNNNFDNNLDNDMRSHIKSIRT